MNILIIEDESKAAVKLSELLCSIDDRIHIIGVIDSIEQGVEWFAANGSPELIFSDIELADGDSFELFNQVNVSCPIIFCTAYNQYMLEAFETNAVSYILKPISREQVEQALEKYYSMRAVFSSFAPPPFNSVDELLNLFYRDKKHYKSTILVNQGERIVPISVDEIAYIYVSSSGMQIKTMKNKEYAYNSTLDKVNELLNPADFFHANRQFVIARRSIHSIERYFNRKLLIKLNYSTCEQILVSRLKVKSFLEWMEL